ncbi:hypothetical protein HOF78_04045 [Candidatus Woesearchaeota archaeon]|jgi:hypothetical protein|nr:hypothetical protein [Candidatus Woesearchaeota archaeon]MBT6044467.1 hypothetical protein [Candidatus Woesearchaeota archaeon]
MSKVRSLYRAGLATMALSLSSTVLVTLLDGKNLESNVESISPTPVESSKQGHPWFPLFAAGALTYFTSACFTAHFGKKYELELNRKSFQLYNDSLEADNPHTLSLPDYQSKLKLVS